jgi:hypothetical protein
MNIEEVLAALESCRQLAVQERAAARASAEELLLRAEAAGRHGLDDDEEVQFNLCTEEMISLATEIEGLDAAWHSVRCRLDFHGKPPAPDGDDA